MRHEAFYALTLSMVLTVSAQLSWATELGTQKEGKRAVNPFAKNETGFAIDRKKSDFKELQESSNSEKVTPSIKIQQLIRAGGGADTGGGDAFGSPKASPFEISEYIEKSKAPSVYILRRLEFIFINGGVPEFFGPLAKKLFQSAKTIYQALSEAQLEPLEKGPCRDAAGNEVDASAKDFPKICFSLERLSTKLNKDSVQAEVLAIVIHEVSHGLETSEPEAIFLQKMVKESLANDPFKKIPNLVNAYKGEIKDTVKNLTYLNAQLQQLQIQEICSGLSVTLPTVNNLFQKNMNSLSDSEKNGVAYSSPKYIAYLQGVLLKSLNSVSYCMAGHPSYKAIINVYKGRKEISLVELQTSLYPDGKNMIPVPNWTVRRLVPADFEALKAEIKDMQTALEEVFNNI